ncbi:MAG: tRNA (adenosine(37)-N6)-dimethylallyltransferase MiaA [Phycisphaerae bacterium]|nr:tRNA (adenosine(37)-N6)-dimethylallyltransferase MiaA [Phycisphaerae bacterium]
MCHTVSMRRVYFILGCTACGKAAVGRELARRLGARILSVDSMKVYRRMDIGTATPSPEALAEIPHYAVNVVEPSESYSVAQYVACAEAAVEDTRAAGAIPLAVGGTSLYIKALTEGLFEGPGADETVRAELTARAKEEGSRRLHEELTRVDPPAAGRIHPNDEKRILRALEVFRVTGTPISELQTQWDSPAGRFDGVLIGLRRDKADQSRRINARVKRMVDMGLREEVERLLAEPKPISEQARMAVGYAELIDHFQGRCCFEEAVERIKINTRRLAKKQRTWHRRFPDVTWFDLPEDDTVETLTERILQTVRFE